VDPYQNAESETAETGLGLVEVKGHRIEIVHGTRVRAMQVVYQEYERFLMTKVGGLEHVYVAESCSEPDKL
jgi:hypothetical protein